MEAHDCDDFGPLTCCYCEVCGARSRVTPLCALCWSETPIGLRVRLALSRSFRRAWAPDCDAAMRLREWIHAKRVEELSVGTWIVEPGDRG